MPQLRPKCPKRIKIFKFSIIYNFFKNAQKQPKIPQTPLLNPTTTKKGKSDLNDQTNKDLTKNIELRLHYEGFTSLQLCFTSVNFSCSSFSAVRRGRLLTDCLRNMTCVLLTCVLLSTLDVRSCFLLFCVALLSSLSWMFVFIGKISHTVLIVISYISLAK